MSVLEIALSVAVVGLSVGLAVALRGFEAFKRKSEMTEASRASWENMAGTWERHSDMWRKLAFEMLGDEAERRFAIRDEVRALLAESAPAGIAERCNRIVEILDKPAPTPPEAKL